MNGVLTDLHKSILKALWRRGGCADVRKLRHGMHASKIGKPWWDAYKDLTQSGVLMEEGGKRTPRNVAFFPGWLNIISTAFENGAEITEAALTEGS